MKPLHSRVASALFLLPLFSASLCAQGYGSHVDASVLTRPPGDRQTGDLRLLVSVTASGNTTELLAYILSHPTTAQAKADLWQAVQSARLDQQTGSSAVSAASTAIVSKGVTSLLGLAFESGAVNRTTSDNVATLTVSTSELAALLSGGKLPACSLIDEHCGAGRSFLRSTSVSTSFDVANSSTGSSSSLAGSAQNALTGGSGSSFTGASVREDFHVRKKTYDAKAFADTFGADATRTKLVNFGTAADNWYTLIENDPGYLPILVECVDSLRTITDPAAQKDALRSCEVKIANLVQSKPTLVAGLAAYASAANAYFAVRDAALALVLFNTTFSASYDYTRAAKQPAQPSLSNITIVYSGRYSPGKSADKVLQLTGNASGTFYNSREGAVISPVRSGQASAQVDYTATPSTSNLQAALSGGYYFQYMASNGLLSLPATALAPGTAIPISGNASQVLNTSGPIHIGQAKVTFSIKNKNISLPFALTFASRSDLLKASRVTGNFGISYDFSTLLPSGK